MKFCEIRKKVRNFRGRDLRPLGEFHTPKSYGNLIIKNVEVTLKFR